MQEDEGVIQIMPADGWAAIYDAGGSVDVLAFGLTNFGRVVPLVPNWEKSEGNRAGRVMTGIVPADECEGGYLGVGRKGKDTADATMSAEEFAQRVMLMVADMLIKAASDKPPAAPEPQEPEPPKVDPHLLRPGETPEC